MSRLLALACALAFCLAQAAGPAAAMPLLSPPTTTPFSLWNTLAFDASHAGTGLSLSGLTKTFSDDFRTNGCQTIGVETGSANPGYKWWSYNNVVFSGNGSVTTNLAPITASPSPFACTVANGLGITITNVGGNINTWQSGLIEAQNQHKDGFQQLYGVFEAVMMFPPITAANICPWGAFWFKSQNAVGVGNQYNEPDQFELCLASSSDPTQLQTTWHYWDADSPPYNSLTTNSFIKVVYTKNIADGNYHTFDLVYTQQYVRYLIDGAEVYRFQLGGNDMRQPLYMLFNNGVFYQPGDTGETYTMYVQKVTAWACVPATQCVGR